MASTSSRRKPSVVSNGPGARRGALHIVIGDGDAGPDAPPEATILEDGGLSITVGGGADAGENDPEAIKKFDANLAAKIDRGTLGMLAEELLEAFAADEEGRADWLDTANKAARWLGIKLEEPSATPTGDGTIVKAISTVMLEAAVRMWSTARAELLPVGGPVKVKRDDVPANPFPTAQGGAPQPGGLQPAPAGIGHNGGPPLDKDKVADALEQDMNWYLTVGDREYYPDFSKMLFHRNLIGMAFRKVYFDPLARKPRSVWVKAQNLVVSNDATHLSNAGRVTEIIPMRQAVMRRLQRKGVYLDIPLVLPTGEVSDTERAVGDIEGVKAETDRPEDNRHTLLEMYVELSSDDLQGLELLDRDENGEEPGYPLPYRVTIDKDSRQILEIRRAWKRGDPDYRRRRRYIAYGCVPGIGFYDLGLIHLVGNPTLAATMLERSSVDAALFANFPGGLMLGSPTGRRKQSVFRPSPGEFIQLEGQVGDDIRKSVMPLPYKGASAEALELMQTFEERVKRIVGTIELPVGEGRAADIPVGTMMAYVEAISQVPSAIHKDDFVAMAEEFELLRELIAEDPEVLIRGNRTPARRWTIAEELLAPDITPAADPNTPSIVHRLMKLQANVTLGGLPQFEGTADNRAIYAKAQELLCGDPTANTLPPQPPGAAPPDPRIVAAQIKAQSQQQSDAADLQKAKITAQSRETELQQEAEQRDADRQSNEIKAAMGLEAARIREAHGTHNAAADRLHDTLNQAADRAQDHAQHLNELAAGAGDSAAQAAGAMGGPPGQGEGGGS